MARKLFSLIGEVFVDNDKANSSLSKTESKAGGVAGALGKGVKAAGKFAVGMGAGMAVAGAAVMKLAGQTAEQTDRIDKLSQQLGLSREGFQKWDYVMSQSGVSIDSMTTGMKTLAQKMGDVASGTGPGIKLFEQLGVAVTDSTGAVRSQEDVFNDAITAFQGMEEGAVKSDLALQLFGRNGMELMPLLNSTAESTENLKNKAQEMGLVLSDETVDAGVNFTDTMDTLKRTLGGLMAQGIGPMLPLINSLAEQFTKILPTLMAFIAPLMEKLVPVIGELLSKLLPAFIAILDAIMPVLDPLIALFLLFVDAILLPLIDLLVPIIDQLMPVFIALFDALIPVLQPIIEMFMDLVKLILPILVDIISTLLPLLLPFIELFAVLAQAIMPIIVELFKLFAPLLEAVVPILEFIFELLSPIIEGITTVVKGIGSFIGSLFGGKDKDIPGLAEGGIVTKSGMTLVGEAGPELLNLPSGSSVIPLDQSSSTNVSMNNVFNITDKATADYAVNQIARKLQGRGVALANR